jgi:hypothetical protein
MKTDYIKCKHGKRRWSIVCMHLLDGSSMEWIPIPQLNSRRKLNDWVCPECDRQFEKMMQAGDISKLRPICVDCVETIRRVFDKNYKPINQKETMKRENRNTNTRENNRTTQI